MSYVSIREEIGAKQTEEILEMPGAGIFLYMTRSATRGSNPELAFEGAYLRGMIDGSVQHRRVIWMPTSTKDDDIRNVRSATAWLFTDQVPTFPELGL